MTLATDLVVDISLDELDTDPYPAYRWLRENMPVAYLPGTDQVLVTTWDLCEQAGKNDTVFSPDGEFSSRIFGSPNILALNGPEHTAMRNRINPPFRPRAVRGYREDLLRATARHYIGRVRDHGRADAVGEILEPISQRAVGDLIGFNDVADDTLARWLAVYAAWVTDFGRDATLVTKIDELQQELRQFITGRIAPGSDWATTPPTALWHMLHDGMPDEQTRDVDDLIGNLGVLIVGGFQEPAHAAAGTLYGLLGREEQAAAVAANPAELSAIAVEEGLRWLSPFGTTEKRTTAAVDLAGVHLPAGTPVALVIGSANRDPSRWDDPDTYDLFRAPLSHASFGYGLHFCIGHHTASNLAQVVLEELFTMLPGLRLDPDHPTTVRGWVARGPKTMPIVWDAP